MLRQIKLTSMMVLVFFMFSIFSPYLQYAEATIYSSISGTIKDYATNVGVEGIKVIAVPISTVNSTLFSETFTGKNGKYILDMVPSGLYKIIIYPKAPYITIPQFQDIVVPIGRNIVNLDFSIKRGGGISGTIYQSDGVVPLVNTKIFVYTDENGFGETVTNSNGKYSLTGLPPTFSTNVKILVPGYITIIKQNINIIENKISENINITIPTGGIISLNGTVTTESGEPIENAMVIIYSENYFGTISSGSDGIYSFTEVTSDSYNIFVIKLGYNLYFKSGVSLTSNTTEVINVILSLQQAGSIIANNIRVSSFGDTQITSATIDECNRELEECFNHAMMNELNCIKGISDVSAKCVLAAISGCVFAGVGYLPCVNTAVGLCGLGAAFLLDVCHIALLAELAACMGAYLGCKLKKCK